MAGQRFHMRLDDNKRIVIQAYEVPGKITSSSWEYAHLIVHQLVSPELEPRKRRTLPLHERMKSYMLQEDWELPALELPDGFCDACQRYAHKDDSKYWVEHVYPGGATYTFTCQHCNYEESASV